MNLLVTPEIWRETAQNDLGSRVGYAARILSHSISRIADASSKPSVCTSQYRYPSPSKRFGTFGTGPLFSWRNGLAFERKTAEKQSINSGDSLENLNLLWLPSIKTIVGGTNQCRSNTWPLLPFLLHRSPVAWITTSSAQELALLRVPLWWAPLGAVCSPVRLSAQAQARCVTMSAYATSLAQKIRTGVRPKITTDKLTNAGTFSRWFFALNRKLATKVELRGGLQPHGSSEEARPDCREKSLVCEWNVIVEKCDSDAREGAGRGMKNRCRVGTEYLGKAC